MTLTRITRIISNSPILMTIVFFLTAILVILLMQIGTLGMATLFYLAL